MKIVLAFSHDKKDAARVCMSIDGGALEKFDYVAFVKVIFANSDAEIVPEVDSSYTEEQKTQLEGMVRRLEEKARGAASEDEKEAKDKIGSK